MASSGNSTEQAIVLDAFLIGAGFAGLYAIYKLRGLGLSLQAVETGDGVGGTWYWNRYPGARCDINSLEYSYSFSDELQQEWEWSERYAAQPEILRYINHVADRFDLRPHIRFRTRVTAAHFDDARGRWKVRCDDGTEYDVKYLISGVGSLSGGKDPEIPGIESFEGEIYRTSSWPHHAVDFTGLRVGLIGTGSSGIQSSTAIARDAKSLTVFQRTANFSVPAQNRRLTREELDDYKRDYPELRRRARNDRAGVVVERGTRSALDATPQERQDAFDACWDFGQFGCLSASFNDLLVNRASNDTVADYVRSRIAGIVEDARTRDDLTPRGYPFGTKRVCMDTGYFDIFNQPNVELVNLKREPIETVTPTGLRTGEREFTFDAMVFATGFDAFTGPLLSMDIRGRGGRSLADHWAQGPRTYLGLQSAGFPNFFMIGGPGSPSVVSNLVLSIEQHVDWLTRCIDHMERNGIATIEASEKAEDDWCRHVADLANATLYPTAPSYIVGANVPGKPRVFLAYLGGVPRYREECEKIEQEGYAGFLLDAEPQHAKA